MDPQVLANGLAAGCAYLLVGTSFALIYSTSKTFHFAHGAVYTLGAYVFFDVNQRAHTHPSLALGAAILAAVLLGTSIDVFVYRPLRGRKSLALVQLLSSIGVYSIVVNALSMFHGNESKVLDPGQQQTIPIGPVILTVTQIITIISALLTIGVSTAILRSTRWGRMIRALQDDPELLQSMGLNTVLVRTTCFAVGSALAAYAAVLSGLELGIDPNIGMSAILNGAVVVIIGGLASLEGAAIGALLLGFLQALAVWALSSQWQEGITFTLLILFLFFRPEGIVGVRRRVEEAP
jgi:branched-chain amino acid transport system permease protein